MSGVTFELQRVASVNGGRGEVLSWVGQVNGLGGIQLAFPTEHSDYPSEYCEVAVSGESFPLTTYLGLRYLRRPLFARGEFRVDWDPAVLSDMHGGRDEGPCPADSDQGAFLSVRTAGRQVRARTSSERCRCANGTIQLEEAPHDFGDLLRRGGRPRH